MKYNWADCHISDLCEIKYGKALKSESRIDGMYPVFGSNGIVGYHNESLVEKDSIVIGRKGSIGEVHFSAVSFWPIDTTYYLNFDRKQVHPQWLYRLLKTLNLKTLNRSAAIPGLNRDDIYRIKTQLPPLTDQIRIAAILTRAEKLIAKRKESIKALDELLKSTFLEMFGDPVRNEKRWAKDKIRKAIKVQGGYAFKSKDLLNSGQVKIVKIANVHFENLIWDDITYVPDQYLVEQDKFSLKEGDLLIALTRPIIKSLDVVKTATVRQSDLPCLLNQRVARFNFDTKTINKKFFLHFCYTSFFKNTVDNLCPPCLQPNVSTTQIENIPIYYPPLSLQNQFASIVTKVESIKSKYTQSLTALENLYSSLSQRAFKGELDLSKVPVDVVVNVEPAEIKIEPIPPIVSTTKSYSGDSLRQLIKTKSKYGERTGPGGTGVLQI